MKKKSSIWLQIPGYFYQSQAGYAYAVDADFSLLIGNGNNPRIWFSESK